MENYEEKYKNLIKQLKKAKEKHGGYTFSSVVDNIVQELHESEDEKIRKAIIEALSRQSDSEKILKDWGIFYEDAIAWLEKQGEKYLFNFDEAEKEKNDFVSGQFIECRKSFNDFKEFGSYWFEYVGDDTYIGRSDNILNQRFHITPRQLFTLFTHEHCPKEEKQYEQNPSDKIEPKFKVGDWIVSKTSNLVYRVDSILFPQSKCYYLSYNGGIVLVNFADEQNYRLWTIQDAEDGDVLFDGSNILLFKRINDWHNVMSYLAYSQVYSIREHFISNSDVIVPATKEQRDLLFKKMKEAGYEWDAEKKELRKIEQKPAWSENDERMFSGLISIVEDWYNTMSEAEKEYYGDCGYINWLNSLKDKIQPQPKQEWSEDILIEGIKQVGLTQRQIDWLKSLKPQPRWNPTEEQMEALKYMVDYFGELTEHFAEYEEIKSLYNDLKSL